MTLNEMLALLADFNKNAIQQPIPIIPYYMMLGDYKFTQVRFPKSKKMRIRKKWTKQQTNYKYVEQPKIVCAYDRIYANRLAYNLLNNHFKINP